MAPSRNQQQLILVKQLYEDARLLEEKGDAFSLTKAVVLLDLSIEHILNNIILNLDPSFTVNQTKGTGDIDRRTLWGNASTALRAAGKKPLSEVRELANLHALRNLVQHIGMEPAQSEAHRYLTAASNMLTSIFEDVYELSFENFKLWDLVSNIELRDWLRDSEQALKNGDPLRCIGACNHAHALIIGAIRTFTKLRRFRASRVFSSSTYSPSLPAGFPQQAMSQIQGMAKRIDNEIRGGVERFRKEIMQEIEFLEDEVVAIGVGLPLMDTRRFQKIGSLVLIFISADGHMQSRSKVTDQDRNEIAKDAEFMLDYLSRLIRLLDEAYPGVLENIKIPLPLQESWGRENSAASPGSG